MRRYLAGMLLGWICLAALLPRAWAAEDVAVCEGRSYASLADAVAAAPAGAVIELIGQARENVPIVCNRPLTIDGTQGALTIGPRGYLEVRSDVTLEQVEIETGKFACGSAPLVISADGASLSLRSCTLALSARDGERDTYTGMPHAIQIDRTPGGGRESPADIRLMLENTRIDIPSDGAYAVACAADTPGSVITMTDSVLFGMAAGGDNAENTTRGAALYLPEGGDVSVQLTGCTLRGFRAGLEVGADGTDVSLSETTVSAITPLRILGSDAALMVDADSLLSCEGQTADNRAHAIEFARRAEGNTVTLSDSGLLCALSGPDHTLIQTAALGNAVYLESGCTVETASDAPLCAGELDTLEAAPDVTFGAGYEIVMRRADGSLRNACGDLTTAQTLWQAGDTATLRGPQTGALFLDRAVTLCGTDGASLSGSLSIASPEAALHGFDLSNCTVSSPYASDLSGNYWGGLPPVSVAARVVPYCSAPDGPADSYLPVGEEQITVEWDIALDEIERAWAVYDASDRADTQTMRDAMRAACDRLRQTVPESGRAQALLDDPALRARADQAWMRYRIAFPLTVGDTMVKNEIAGPLTGESLALAGRILDNLAGKQAAEITISGTACPGTETVHAVIALAGVQPQADGGTACFHVSVEGEDGRIFPASETQIRYRLPLPQTGLSQVTVQPQGGQSVTLPIEQSADGAYAVLNWLGELSVTWKQPALPDVPGGGDLEPPHTPDTPDELPPEPELPAPRLILSRTAHGTLTLRTGEPKAAGERVRIHIEPDAGYELTDLYVQTAYDAVDYRLDGMVLEFRMPGETTRVRAVFRRAADAPVPPADGLELLKPEISWDIDSADVPFHDLSPDAWYYADAVRAWQMGLFQGTDAQTFAPDEPMTRAMLAAILHRQAGAPQGWQGGFSDVLPGCWYDSAVGWAQARGMVRGMPDGTFRPEELVTREQLVTILHRAFGAPETQAAPLFTDQAQIAPWARSAAAWCAQVGIVRGDGQGAFLPRSPATRAETASLLMRWLDVG